MPTISREPHDDAEVYGTLSEQFTHVLVSLVERRNEASKLQKGKVTFPFIHEEPQVLTPQPVWQE